MSSPAKSLPPALPATPTSRISLGHTPSEVSVDSASVLGRDGWDGESATCQICNETLGKRRLKPRHHCRFCGRCVCGDCSRSQITVENTNKTERACVVCAGNVSTGPGVAERLVQLGGKMRQLATGGAGAEAQAPEGLTQAAGYCEMSFGVLQDAFREQRARRLQADNDLAIFTTFLWNFGERLQQLTGTSDDSLDAATRFRAGEPKVAMDYCEALLKDVEALLSSKKGARNRSRTPRDQSPSVAGVPIDQLQSGSVHGSNLPTGNVNAPMGRGGEVSWQNTPECEVCGSALGKLRLKFRHHCRLCNRCVCSKCSRSCVPVDGTNPAAGRGAVERACNPCAANARLATASLSRLQRLGERLDRLSGLGGSRAPSTREPNLEDAMSQCEATLAQLEEAGSSINPFGTSPPRSVGLARGGMR